MSNEQPARKWSKTIIGGIVGLGTSTIVRQTIANNTEKSGIGLFTIPVAGLVIGMMAGDATKNYIHKSVDALFDQLEEAGLIQVTEIDAPA